MTDVSPQGSFLTWSVKHVGMNARRWGGGVVGRWKVVEVGMWGAEMFFASLIPIYKAKHRGEFRGVRQLS